MRITELVHETLVLYIKDYDKVIDATVGNGYDTLFLANLVKEEGCVIGVDIQNEALRNTQKLLDEHDISKSVVLYQIGHEKLDGVISEDWYGCVSCVMFNLGYRPGGDKKVITLSETTIMGLNLSLKIIKPGGLISIVVYPDHKGGAEEASKVNAWVESLNFELFETIQEVISTKGPKWYLIQKKS